MLPNKYVYVYVYVYSSVWILLAELLFYLQMLRLWTPVDACGRLQDVDHLIVLKYHEGHGFCAVIIFFTRIIPGDPASPHGKLDSWLSVFNFNYVYVSNEVYIGMKHV